MKQKKFKLIFSFLLVMSISIASFNSYSQEKKKVLEISTYSFDQFGIRYKFGNEKRLFRISSMSAGLTNYKHAYLDDATTTVNAGLGFGIEFPKQINDNLSLYYGSELRGHFNIQKSEDNEMYSLALNGIFGFAYQFNEVIKLGAEITPGFSYENQKQDDHTSDNFRFGFQNYGAALVLGFCF